MKGIVVLSLIIALIPAALWAQAQPHNDPLSLVSSRPRPNVLFLVDTSGSMLWDIERPDGYDITVRKEEALRPTSTHYALGSANHACYLIDSDNPRSRLGQAKAAIREISSQLPDVNLGIGRFKKTLILNRFRASVPADLDPTLLLDNSYRYDYYDDQVPALGQINVPMQRHHGESNKDYYPFARIVRRYNSSGAYAYWTIYDPTSITWSDTMTDIIYAGGEAYIRLNWNSAEINSSRYMQYNALNGGGDQIFRGDYLAPDPTHRNKLNQVDNIDIFMSDLEFIQLKENTPLGDPLIIERYVEQAYGIGVQRTLTFTYFPTCADWDSRTGCAGGEVLVDIQNRFNDVVGTGADESYNRDEIAATAGVISTNAKVYDFSVEPVQLTDTGTFYGIGGTPLGATLQAARDYFENTIIPRDQSNQVGRCRDNFVVLLTDGIEGCGGNPSSDAAYLYNTLGIKTYVIAFATITSEADEIAANGGTEQALRAMNRAELVAALNSIFTDIQHSVQLAAPIAASTTRHHENVVEGDVVILPFFDVPGFNGRLQARKLFKNAVVAVDPKTGAIETDAAGDPIIIEDDITEERIVQLIEDPNDPIGRDPSREIVGIQHDPPLFMWEAGELLSLQVIEKEFAELIYPYLEPDSADLDGDGDTTEEIVNPAYQTADERRVLTTLGFGLKPDVIRFNFADLIGDVANRDLAISRLDVSGWPGREISFLINYIRGKTIQRFSEPTTLYGINFNAGDPMPDPGAPDNNGDGVPDNYLYVERDWKLGDIIASTPVIVTPPLGDYLKTVNDDDLTDTTDYEDFVAANADIPTLVIAGANDGMLHAFSLMGIDLNDDGDFDDAGEFYPGEEVWSFILPDMMWKLKALYYDSPDDDDYIPDGQRFDPHLYFFDAQITLAIVRARIHDGDTDNDGRNDDPEFRIMMFLGEGRGGKYYWAFDLTNPLNPKPIWSLTDPTMGRSLSRPAVGPVEVGASAELDNDTFKYYTFFGSGYDYSQTDGNATVGNVIYMVDINDGNIIQSQSVGDESGGAGIPNAIVSRAILVDDDEDFFIERAYFGDLDGNIWRFDISGPSFSGGVNLLEASPSPLTTVGDRLDRPIMNSLTYANVFGTHMITAGTGGDTRLYYTVDKYRAEYPVQRIYMLVDTNQEGEVESILNGEINDDGDFTERVGAVGIEMLDYQVAENIPVVSAFTEYDDTGKIYRGFQTFYPLYTPDAMGLHTIRCTFGQSDLLMLDSVFSESNLVETTSGSMLSMGAGKGTGITYVGGNLLFSIGDQFKIYGSGVYRFESNQRVKAKLKVLEWREVY